MTEAIRDQNRVTASLGQSSTDATVTLPLLVDPVTGRLLTDMAGGGAGTVTDFSFNDDNGFVGTVTNATTTPELTLETDVSGIIKGSGGALTQAAAGTDYTDAAFKTISVAGQSDVVADDADDTLTLAAGSNITITTDAGTDTITIAAAGGGGTVDTVVGTANRISVDSTDPANPVIDIAATYVGQNTITTLGTIGTGTWNGTAIAGQYGGTGVANTGKTITVSGNTILGSNSDTLQFTTTGNTNVTLPTSGTLATTTYVPTAITVANEATDTTCFVAFFTAASGDLGPKTNANITFNSNTGVTTLASSVLTTTDINGGTIDGTVIGGASAAAITGTAIVGTSLSVGTGGVITAGTIELGAATDTTIARASAGQISVEGVQVVTLSNTVTMTNKTLSHTVEPASDDTFTGEQITGFNAGATVAQWEAVYLSSSSTWLLTDADATGTAGGVMVCLAAAAGTNGNPLTVVRRGVIRNDGWTWSTVGAPLYLSTTAGAITQTAPSGTDDVVRVVGYVLSDDCIYFDPSNDWITRT